MATDIEWADETWNPTVGCSRVDHRCDGCYAIAFTHRGLRPEHGGITKLRPRGANRPGVDWTGEVRMLPERLPVPLRWRKGRRVFVDSLSDLFHPAVPFGFIAAVFAIMAATPQHTYLVLTKRPKRAREFFEWVDAGRQRIDGGPPFGGADFCGGELYNVAHHVMDDEAILALGHPIKARPWPLPNVQLGVSVSDQPTWDADVPEILRCPAALHFVSLEPILGAVDVRESLPCQTCKDVGSVGMEMRACPTCGGLDHGPRLGWVVVGGESGHRSRPNILDWTRSVIRQCREVGVPVFHKQVGERAMEDGARVHQWPLGAAEWNVGRTLFRPKLSKAKGGDMADWPEDLRVRELPEVPRG